DGTPNTDFDYATLDFSLSADGSCVAFAGKGFTSDPDPAPGSTGNQVYVYNDLSNTFVLASPSLNGGYSSGASNWPILSQEGRYVLFFSNAPALVANYDNGQGVSAGGLFVRDVLSGRTLPMSANPAGTASVPLTPGGGAWTISRTANPMTNALTVAFDNDDVN